MLTLTVYTGLICVLLIGFTLLQITITFALLVYPSLFLSELNPLKGVFVSASFIEENELDSKYYLKKYWKLWASQVLTATLLYEFLDSLYILIPAAFVLFVLMINSLPGRKVLPNVFGWELYFSLGSFLVVILQVVALSFK